MCSNNKVMKLFFKKVKKLNKGFTLVETLVAISIFSVSIVGLMSVLGSGISNTNYAKQKIAAYYLAQEGIECIRNTRDNYVLFTGETGWSDFLDLVPQNISCPSIDSDSGFTRALSKTPIPPDEAKIFSTVSWTQGSGNYNIVFSENLFNWTD
ncbi:MAG: prepilin-type N-terminal cleavage/methylation domain-containing protein [Candidatus Paceibacterota bacterium]